MAEENGLCADALACLDHVLEVTTVCGWDWHGAAGHVPPPFHIRLLELVECDGRRTGGIGRVESIGHAYHDWYIEFHLRHMGSYDFVKTTGTYSIWLSAHSPRAIGEQPRVFQEVMGWASPIECTDPCHSS